MDRNNLSVKPDLITKARDMHFDKLTAMENSVKQHGNVGTGAVINAPEEVRFEIEQMIMDRISLVRTRDSVNSKYGTTFSESQLRTYRDNILDKVLIRPPDYIEQLIEKAGRGLDIFFEREQLIKLQRERIIRDAKIEEQLGKNLKTQKEELEFYNVLLDSHKKDLQDLGVIANRSNPTGTQIMNVMNTTPVFDGGHLEDVSDTREHLRAIFSQWRTNGTSQ